MSGTDSPPTGMDPHTNPKAAAKAEKAYKKASRPWFRKKRWWALGLILIFAIAVANGMGGDDSDTTTATDSSSSQSNEPTADEPAAADEPDMTSGQENALRAAENYLDLTPFSRAGLINQLSSDAGDGYSVEDATFAADNVEVDWNDQAAKAAQNYLDLMPFSREGLIEQLSSEAGDRYTLEQATYGVDQAGL